MASSDSQIDKPQHGCPKRAELPDVNINTGAQSINTERASLINRHVNITCPKRSVIKEILLAISSSLDCGNGI